MCRAPRLSLACASWRPGMRVAALSSRMYMRMRACAINKGKAIVCAITCAKACSRYITSDVAWNACSKRVLHVRVPCSCINTRDRRACVACVSSTCHLQRRAHVQSCSQRRATFPVQACSMCIVAALRAAVLQEHCGMQAMHANAGVVAGGVSHRLASVRRAEMTHALRVRECGVQQCAHVHCCGAKGTVNLLEALWGGCWNAGRCESHA